MDAKDSRALRFRRAVETSDAPGLRKALTEHPGFSERLMARAQGHRDVTDLPRSLS